MKLIEVLGRSIKEIWVKIKLEPGGLDQADISIRLDNDKIIGFPWDFDVENICKPIAKGARELFKNHEFRKVKNQTIKDVIIQVEESGETGFFELENGLIIYESTMFFHGVLNVGLKIFDSLKEFENEEGMNYKRLKKY